MFGEPVVTNSCAFYFLHARLRVRLSTRHSLCPLLPEGCFLGMTRKHLLRGKARAWLRSTCCHSGSAPFGASGNDGENRLADARNRFSPDGRPETPAWRWRPRPQSARTRGRLKNKQQEQRALAQGGAVLVGGPVAPSSSYPSLKFVHLRSRESRRGNKECPWPVIFHYLDAFTVARYEFERKRAVQQFTRGCHCRPARGRLPIRIALSRIATAAARRTPVAGSRCRLSISHQT